jgi:hypothetical protein
VKRPVADQRSYMLAKMPIGRLGSLAGAKGLMKL